MPKSASHSDASETAITELSNSSLASTRRNINYLLAPTSTASRNNASSIGLRTRLLLRSLHSLGAFIIWRLVRYAKYIAVGSVIAALGASAFGTVLTPVGWLVAPPTFAASIIAASVWGVGRFAARRIKERLRKDGSLKEGQASAGMAPGNSDGFHAKRLGEPAITPW